MIKKLLYAVVVAMIGFSISAYAQMNDEDILDYISQGIANGKTQSQIGNELLAKGVTIAQAKRMMLEYSKNLDSDGAVKPKQLDNSRPTRGAQEVVAESVDKEDAEKMAEKKVVLKSKEGEAIIIYGHELFKAEKLSFEPNMNVATPASYVLGPGDEVIIDVWGMNETTIKQTISPEGQIFLSQIGPVTLSGLTIAQATKKIKSSLSNIYSLSGPEAASQMSLSLSKVRTIMVNVLGEVTTPGTYRLSGLATVAAAVYRAGGVTNIGSLRNIKLSRDGKIINEIDLYKFIFDGVTTDNIRLQDADVIIVPAYESLVKVTEGFKRPMYYEAKNSDNINDFIKYSGGFVANASPSEVSVQRKTGTGASMYTLDKSQFADFKLRDGDILLAYQNQQEDLFQNMVTVKGAVLRPGSYELGKDIATVRQLIEHAGGLLPNSFLLRAQIIRENPDRSMSLKSIAIGAIVDGSISDEVLVKNDVIIISDKSEIEKKGNLTITGYVVNPGDYEYAEGTTIEDLILLSGGLEEGASSAKVDVSRRIVDTKSLNARDTLALVYTCSLGDSLGFENGSNFVLEPYDIVSIRKSPSYVAQRRVRISGEATFPGEYTLVSNDERISDLFRRAGGATCNAYIGGAVLKRKVSEDERNVRRNMVNMIRRGGNRKDSVMVNKLKINETYTVGISLDLALKNPGSENDLVLHDGDELVIPSMTNTVRIQGEVMYPNAVNYMKGENVKYYIDQAGGYSNEARRAKVYVVYMNGKVSVGRGAKIVPGCEVVVPSRGEKKPLTVGEWMAIGTTAASLTTMIVTIANLVVANTTKSN